MTLAYAVALPQRLLVGASDSKDETSFQQQTRAIMPPSPPIAQGKTQGVFLTTCFESMAEYYSTATQVNAQQSLLIQPEARSIHRQWPPPYNGSSSFISWLPFVFGLDTEEHSLVLIKTSFFSVPYMKYGRKGLHSNTTTQVIQYCIPRDDREHADPNPRSAANLLAMSLLPVLPLITSKQQRP